MEYFRRRLILIADDNRDFARSSELLLELAGFDVEAVYDGWDALKVAKSRTPDVILLDIGLPGLNGFQVAEQVRNDACLKDVLIIAISGYSSAMLPGRFEQVAFNFHLVKPVDFKALLSLICRPHGSFGGL
jgi:CheY-like chemotaxis protein